MSVGAAPWRVVVHPGDGLVARVGDAVLVVAATSAPAARAALLAGLTRGVEAAETEGAAAVVRELGRSVLDVPSPTPNFAAVVVAARDVVLMVGPGMEASWSDADGDHRLGSGDAATWADRVLGEPFAELRVGPLDAPARPADPLTDLRSGVVPGAGVVLLPAAGGDASGPVAGIDFAVVSLAAPAGEPPVARDPLPVATSAPSPAAVPAEGDRDRVPVVDGAHCARGHFNHPFARFCAVCGIGFEQDTRDVVPGPRPPLGILVFDDGSGFVLDGEYVVGRDPTRHADVVAGRRRPVTLEDPDRSLSRTHLAVSLVDWDVIVEDLGSANGTWVLPPGSAEWSHVPPRAPLRLEPGATIRLGGRSFVFESHHPV